MVLAAIHKVLFNGEHLNNCFQCSSNRYNDEVMINNNS